MNPRYLFFIASLFILMLCHAAPKPKKQLFVPMDYSTCGYRASEQAIPDVPNVLFVEASEGDCSDLLQRCIDYVSTMKPDREGCRGAILLGEGTFRLSQALRIQTSGIVIRGMGKGKTVLRKLGADRGAAIYLEGQRRMTTGDTVSVASEKVTAGSTRLTLSADAGLHVGDRIQIVRPSTEAWITSLAMGDFGGGLDYTGWKPGDIDITWDRTVTAVEGNTLTLDAPLTTAISPVYGGAFVCKGFNQGEMTECGIENLSIEGLEGTVHPKFEDHCWDGIFVENARDCWVRRVDFRRLAGSAVNIQKHVSRMTVEDCVADEPVSEVGGWRRCVFLTRGQQTLIQRCISRHGIHDFAAGYCAAGPNAFVQCEGEESLGFSGSIGSWAAGLLFDIVNIDGHDLCFRNLEQFQFGTGWNTANSMMWQCTASTLWCYSPDDDNRSSAHGCWGTLTGNGNWTSSNDHVQPRSLFYSQLEQRLTGDSASQSRTLRYDRNPSATTTPPKGWILPRPTDATSSPTPEQAHELAQASLTQPRLTLEMWLDSIPYTASLSAQGLKRGSNLTARDLANSHRPTANKRPVGRGITAASAPFAVTDGHLTVSGRLITGNRYDIPWWSGRVKDNFCEHGARPAITRFVPGREGTGWTDRIDSVVCFLSKGHYALLDHNYGLWYDLRRTDHERVRRADGDVWAPFYEQPFARSGQGTAWDGLSRYDLTQPNAWYWGRLRAFADRGADRGLLLFNNHYFQHNILEAGAHWVDCPWRPVNNVNNTGASFPEPVPFAGDKRIFIAEQFYNDADTALRRQHRQYIRMCLEELKDQPNAVHLISAEYTGPLHFTRFWLQTIAEWEAETGRHPLVALSCTKDAQDQILADKELSRVVDIIDIRYWHYNTDGLWAPKAGGNLAPRQWMRKMKVGKTGQDEAYRAVREYRERYPQKAVTFFSQQYPDYGWAILMAGGSLPNVQIGSDKLLADVSLMRPMDADGCWLLGNGEVGYLVYVRSADAAHVPTTPGRYAVWRIDRATGAVTPLSKSLRLGAYYPLNAVGEGSVLWLQRLGR
ncbi:MAG: pectate lyase [Prevotella sp.]|nr:pectate lyase [Prevotella sp.]